MESFEELRLLCTVRQRTGRHGQLPSFTTILAVDLPPPLRQSGTCPAFDEGVGMEGQNKFRSFSGGTEGQHANKFPRHEHQVAKKNRPTYATWKFPPPQEVACLHQDSSASPSKHSPCFVHGKRSMGMYFCRGGSKKRLTPDYSLHLASPEKDFPQRTGACCS